MTRTDAHGIVQVALARAREIADAGTERSLDERVQQLAHLDATKPELWKAVAYLAAQYVTADRRNPDPVRLKVLLGRVQEIADAYAAHQARTESP